MTFHNYSHFNFKQEESEDETEEETAGEEYHPEVGKVLTSWEAPEFVRYDKGLLWYIVALIFICSMAGYGIYANSPIMSITFILIGVVGYIQTHREPEIVSFSLTSSGVLVGKEFYPYENIQSFWIFYEPPHTKILSLHTTGSFLPYVHIPLDEEDPVKTREILLEHIEEIEQDHSIVNTLERILNL